MPIAMFVASEDIIVNVEDNRKLKNQLKSLVKYKEIGFDHLSFVLAKDMSYFNEVIEMI